MAWRMSKEATEKGGEWLYRAVMAAFVVSMWTKIDSIAVIESRVSTLERRTDKIEDALFAPAFDRKKRMESHLRETDSVFNVYVENLNDSQHQLVLIDSLLTASN